MVSRGRSRRLLEGCLAAERGLRGQMQFDAQLALGTGGQQMKR